MRTLSIHPYIRAAVLIGAGPNLVGCSGTTDAGPSIPRVAGTYSITESVTAVTCTPQEPPAGGTVQLEAFSQTFDVQIDQTGSALKLYDSVIQRPLRREPSTRMVGSRSTAFLPLRRRRAKGIECSSSTSRSIASSKRRRRRGLQAAPHMSTSFTRGRAQRPFTPRAAVRARMI
jgi:hypothetical protein